MLEKIKLNQCLIFRWDITLKEAIVLDYILKRKFKLKKSMDFKRNKFVRDLPIVSDNEDDFYLILKSLDENKLICYYHCIEKCVDVIGICDKSLLWIAK